MVEPNQLGFGMFSLIAGTLTQTPNLQHLTTTCSVPERERAGCCNSFSCLLKLSRELTANSMKEWISRGPLLFTEDAHNSGSDGAGRPLVAKTHVCNFKFLISRCVQVKCNFFSFFFGGGCQLARYTRSKINRQTTSYANAHLRPSYPPNACIWTVGGSQSTQREGMGRTGKLPKGSAPNHRASPYLHEETAVPKMTLWFTETLLLPLFFIYNTSTGHWQILLFSCIVGYG